MPLPSSIRAKWAPILDWIAERGSTRDADLDAELEAERAADEEHRRLARLAGVEESHGPGGPA